MNVLIILVQFWCHAGCQWNKFAQNRQSVQNAFFLKNGLFSICLTFYFTSYFQWVQKMPPRIKAKFFFIDSFLVLCSRKFIDQPRSGQLKSDSASKRFRIHSKVINLNLLKSPRDCVAAMDVLLNGLSI